MNKPDNQGSPTRPYLLRALHEWCVDNGFTPFIAVHVDDSVSVPAEHVKNNEIVLNIGYDATAGLKLGNETIEFKARFKGVQREIVVPVDHVVAIYARENGQGMAFPMPTSGEPTPSATTSSSSAIEPTPAGAAPRGRVPPNAPLRLARQDNRAAGSPPAAATPTAGPAGGAGAGDAGAAGGPSVSGAAEAPPPPTPPPEPGAPRPSLKRIK